MDILVYPQLNDIWTNIKPNELYVIRYPEHAPAETHEDNRGLNADLADHHFNSVPFLCRQSILFTGNIFFITFFLLVAFPSLLLFRFRAQYILRS